MTHMAVPIILGGTNCAAAVFLDGKIAADPSYGALPYAPPVMGKSLEFVLLATKAFPVRDKLYFGILAPGSARI